MNYVIRENYNKSELYAYLIIKDILFTRKTTFIGDNGRTPDLMTEDKMLGCEVTMSESPSIFDIINKFRLMDKDKKFDTKRLRILTEQKYGKLKIANKNLPHYFKFSLDKKNSTQEDTEGYFEHFRYIVLKKLKKLNRGNYSGCANVFLMVLSDFRKKDYIKIENVQKVYKDLIKDFSKNFRGMFYTLNDNLYLFDNNGNYRIMKDSSKFVEQKYHTYKAINNYIDGRQL